MNITKNGYSGTDLIKYVQDLYEEYYKTDEIKELNKWREFLSHMDRKDSILSRC